jgi:putative membrane protein insertion efficiency factor
MRRFNSKATHMHRLPRLMWFLVCLLKIPLLLYRKALSPWLGPRCRFYPSCSLYALEALQIHGPFRGSGLTLRRLLRCHPFHPGGIDAVPPPPQGDAASPPHED